MTYHTAGVSVCLYVCMCMCVCVSVSVCVQSFTWSRLTTSLAIDFIHRQAARNATYANTYRQTHTHTHTHLYVPTIHCGESALWGKCVRPSWSLWGTYTHTYRWYIVGKVHCGENLCVLVCVVGKIHTYVQMIHCGESALWGKSVRPSWRCGEKFRFPTMQILFPHSAMFWCASLTIVRGAY